MDNQKHNFQLVLNETLDTLVKENARPRLLLHSCCAPCSSYVLEYLTRFFEITVYYYNPNISPETEFALRAREQQRLIAELPGCENVRAVVEKYDADEFLSYINGFENEPEGGARCKRCFKLRLSKTAEYAKKNGFDYFTTTLTVSPHKNEQVINEIGKNIAESVGVKYLFSDFKKKNGYKRSCELSQIYGLYRQNYCGCKFSQKD